MSLARGLSSSNGSWRGSPQCARCSSCALLTLETHLMTPELIQNIKRILQWYILLHPASSNASLWYCWEEILYEGAVLRLTFLFPQCAASSVSQRGPCNLFSLLRSHIIIVVCIMFIIISIIVPGIYVMFMIIVYRLKPGSFCRLRAYGSLVFVWTARLASQYCFPTLKCECEI